MSFSPPSELSVESDGAYARIASWLPSRRSLAAFGLAVLLLCSTAGLPVAAQSTDSFELTTGNVTSTTNQTITGTTTLEAGTELQVRIRSSGETDPQFLRTDTATVTGYGTWNATFDLSAVETHDTVEVTVAGVDENQSATFEVPVRNDGAPNRSTGSGISTPGFGVLVAVAALLGAMGLARRRR
ncbi:MAG: BGTF surface domain-containing protein [Halobellus sp.]|uniref:BGTF surface domain-containing protein n=1 Tax=Halobellus sp. TaxID=1979212 RepID=UPI0035D411AF